MHPIPPTASISACSVWQVGKTTLGMEFDLADKRHLDAAEGWLELGNWQEAHEELEQITPQRREHPLVLRLRWGIYAKAGKWEMAAEIARALSEVLPGNSWESHSTGLCAARNETHGGSEGGFIAGGG